MRPVSASGAGGSAAGAAFATVGVANPGERSLTPATPAARLNNAEAVTAACRRVRSKPKSRAIFTISPPESVLGAPGGATPAGAASGAAATTGVAIGAAATTGAGATTGAVGAATGAFVTTGAAAATTGAVTGVAADTTGDASGIAGVTGATGGGEVATGLGRLGAGSAVGIAGRAVGTGAVGALGGSTTIGSIRVTVRWRVARRGATGRAQRVARPAGRTHAGAQPDGGIR